MRVGMMGFGKTGRFVAQVLLESPDVSLAWVVRRTKALEHRSVTEFLGLPEKEGNKGLFYCKDEYSAQELLAKYPVDVIVDFSSEDGLAYYAQEAANVGIQIVSAVSRYPDSAIDYLRMLSAKTVVLHSPNITIGINFLIIAAKILKNIAPYTDIEIVEEHFKNKSEISGTAKVIARELSLDESAIKSIRAGGIIGVHEILFGFPYQVVRLKHESISRESFGHGILFAINNLQGKRAGFYTMEELLLPYFKLNDTEDELAQSKKKAWWKFWL